ncbi:hypothetical protein Bca4012_017770 [Brassica carinata]|uniref:Uncharacterized protein n=1 Tax=Brassica carinata TaxID=52824 RepID=A0A8X8BBT9_BRACI|nr:hypothetical protein Bca52824_003844 [Brassica carinata]
MSAPKQESAVCTEANPKRSNPCVSDNMATVRITGVRASSSDFSETSPQPRRISGHTAVNVGKTIVVV